MGKETILLTIREATDILVAIKDLVESDKDPVFIEDQLKIYKSKLDLLIKEITLTLPDFKFRERYKIPVNKFYNLKKNNELKLYGNQVLDIIENVNKLS